MIGGLVNFELDCIEKKLFVFINKEKSIEDEKHIYATPADRTILDIVKTLEKIVDDSLSLISRGECEYTSRMLSHIRDEVDTFL